VIRGLLLTVGLVSSAVAGEPERIAALGVDVEETVAALGEADRVVAVTEHAEGFANATRIGTHRRIATEPLLSTRPSLVLAGGSIGPVEVLDAVEGAGVAVTRLPKPTDLAGVRANIRSIAAALGEVEGGERVVADLDNALAAAPKVDAEVRVAFLYARGAGTLMLAGKGTGVRTIVQATGATAVGDWDGFRPLTDEALVALRPTHLLVTTGGLMSLGGEPALRALTPIRLLGGDLQIVHLHDRLILSTGPKVGEAVHTLAKALGGGA